MFRELPGEGVKNEIEAHIAEAVKSIAGEGVVPKLAVMRAGDDDSQEYYEAAIQRQSGTERIIRIGNRACLMKSLIQVTDI